MNEKKARKDGRNDLVTVYLSGACAHEKNEGREWRRKVTNIFEQFSRYNNVKVAAVNPTNYFIYTDTERHVKSFCLSKLLKSDLVLVNLERCNTSIGTAQEVQYAVDHEIPVIGFNKGKESYGWIEESDCQVAFDTMEQAIYYIINNYLLEKPDPYLELDEIVSA